MRKHQKAGLCRFYLLFWSLPTMKHWSYWFLQGTLPLVAVVPATEWSVGKEKVDTMTENRRIENPDFEGNPKSPKDI